MYDTIGGFVPLDLFPINNFIYHRDARLINTGRNALEYILISLSIKKIFIPVYSCEAIITPILRQGIDYEFYNIDDNFNPLINIESIKEYEYVLYINYYGILDNKIIKLSKTIPNLIVDNTQAFFSTPISNIPTFYSTRKFFGVPDGALLCNIKQNIELPIDKSYNRIQHLLAKIEESTEFCYNLYKQNEELLEKLPISYMSKLTKSILLSTDFEKHVRIRRTNFQYLSSLLVKYNSLDLYNINAPISYPLLVQNGEYIREKLKENKIFTPIYWQNVLQNKLVNSFEENFVKNIISIPIDLRYSDKELDFVVDKIIKYM